MPRIASAEWNIAKLEQILSSHRLELKKLQKQRSGLERKLSAIDQRMGQIGGTVRRGGGKRPQNEHSLADTMEMVMRENGKPIRVNDIVSGVEAKGYRSGSANFKGIVNQQLIKDKRFANVERGIYQLKK